MNTTLLYIILVIFIIAIVAILIYLTEKERVKLESYIKNAKATLENNGIKFNHSYKLVNKEDPNKIRYIRVFELKYVPNIKKVYAHVYMTIHEDEIGTWYDDVKYLHDINKRWEMIDTGCWNPD